MVDSRISKSFHRFFQIWRSAGSPRAGFCRHAGSENPIFLCPFGNVDIFRRRKIFHQVREECDRAQPFNAGVDRLFFASLWFCPLLFYPLGHIFHHLCFPHLSFHFPESTLHIISGKFLPVPRHLIHLPAQSIRLALYLFGIVQ